MPFYKFQKCLVRNTKFILVNILKHIMLCFLYLLQFKTTQNLQMLLLIGFNCFGNALQISACFTIHIAKSFPELCIEFHSRQEIKNSYCLRLQSVKADHTLRYSECSLAFCLCASRQSIVCGLLFLQNITRVFPYNIRLNGHFAAIKVHASAVLKIAE